MPNPLMRPICIEVGDILPEDPPQVPLVQDKQVVEAFAPEASDEPFAERVRAGCPDGYP